MLDPLKTTLAEAKNWLRARILDGEKCPCCNQYAKVYERKLNSGMALALIHIHIVTERLKPQDGWLRIPKDLEGVGNTVSTVLGNREYPKLRYWGLLEPQDDESGCWRITPEGVRFVLGAASVPRTVLLYDGRVLKSVPGQPAHNPPLTDIRTALSDKFDYDELMGKKPAPRT